MNIRMCLYIFPAKLKYRSWVISDEIQSDKCCLNHMSQMNEWGGLGCRRL